MAFSGITEKKMKKKEMKKDVKLNCCMICPIQLIRAYTVYFGWMLEDSRCGDSGQNLSFNFKSTANECQMFVNRQKKLIPLKMIDIDILQ